MTTPQDQAALKPCPFCGGTTIHVSPPTCKRTDKYDPADRGFPIVHCGGCGAEANGKNWDDSCASAIAAWNTRAQPQQPSGWRDIASRQSITEQRLRRCALKYLAWLNVKDPESGLDRDLTDPEMVGDDLAHPAEQQEGKAPTAWMDPDTLDVIHADRKRSWETEHGAGGRRKAASYTVPLRAERQEGGDALHPNHIPDLRYILGVLERVSKASPKDGELSAAVVGMRYVVSRTERAAMTGSSNG